MMSAYFAALVTLPVVINDTGEYITRSGERVSVHRASAHHDFGCSGEYLACGTAERWHKSGRINATSQTNNDIVRQADDDGE